MLQIYLKYSTDYYCNRETCEAMLKYWDFFLQQGKEIDHENGNLANKKGELERLLS